VHENQLRSETWYRSVTAPWDRPEIGALAIQHRSSWHAGFRARTPKAGTAATGLVTIKNKNAIGVGRTGTGTGTGTFTGFRATRANAG